MASVKKRPRGSVRWVVVEREERDESICLETLECN